MRIFIFSEKEPQHVAGHGWLTPGQEVELSDREALYVEQDRTNTSFVPKPEPEPDEPAGSPFEPATTEDRAAVDDAEQAHPRVRHKKSA